jgi:Spy/CpxP family protein refolding chaperone
MMKCAWIVLLLLALPVGASAQRGRAAGAGGQGAMMNRAMLERQIVQRFAEQSSRAMGLGTDERGRFERILRDGNEHRRELAQRGVNVRRRLVEAIADSATPDSEFREILDEIDRIREEEHAQWRADQTAIGGMLTPRQKAVFTARWLRFQEVIRDVIVQRPGPGGQGMVRDTFPFLPDGSGPGREPASGLPLEGSGVSDPGPPAGHPAALDRR